jgi:DNA-binding CsgD family transcriptional regulator
MPSLIARFFGLTGDPELPPKAAMLLAERHGRLSRREAQVVVKAYLGSTRKELSEELEVSKETISTYWKRVYEKTGCHTQEEVHSWLEKLLEEVLV